MEHSKWSFTSLLSVVLLCLSHGIHGIEDHMMSKRECQMWAKLENKTLPLQDQGHANCTTNPDCTGFTCKGIYQDRGLNFGLQVLPCSSPPGVKIFGSAPQFNAKNFSHVFVHGSDYEIPGAILNSSILPASAVHPSSETAQIKGRLEIHLQMNTEEHEMTMGLFIKACINSTCLFRRKVFDGTTIPVPDCNNEIKSDEDLKKAGSMCNINELFSCGENQVCVQLEPENNMGRCQCLQGYDKQDDGSCMSLQDEDEMLAKQREELKKHIQNKENNERKPLPIAKDSGFIQERKPNLNPAPQISGGNSGGAIAAGVVSVLIVILLVTGFTYMITRTRLLPRLRAQITNKPYDDMHFNERGQAIPRSQATNISASTSSVA